MFVRVIQTKYSELTELQQVLIKFAIIFLLFVLACMVDATESVVL